MLILSRHVGEGITLGDMLALQVTAICPDYVELACSFTTLTRVLQPEGKTLPFDQEIVSCRKNERLQIGKDIEIVVVEIRDEKVRLGVDAPPSVAVHRTELKDL